MSQLRNMFPRRPIEQIEAVLSSSSSLETAIDGLLENDLENAQAETANPGNPGNGKLLLLH